MNNDPLPETIAELPDGAHDIKRVTEMPPGMEPKCSIVLLSDGRTMAVELRFPDGTELDETDPSHIFAWYIAHAAPDLLVAAINSWHAYRLKQAASEASIVEPQPKLLGADGHPITAEH